MQLFSTALVSSLCIIVSVCQQIKRTSMRCHDVVRCTCTIAVTSQVTCTDFSSLATNAFDNSKSNISDSFDVLGGFVATPLSKQRFSVQASRGYREITLRNACVSEIEPQFFQHLLSKHINLLWRISITLSVCLVQIQSKTFYNLPQLKILDLSGNSIKHIADGAFDLLPNLENLLLQQNRITTIGDSTFLRLTALRNLDLSSNDLVFISGKSFKTLSSLDSLRLNRNRLKSLLADTFSSLIRLTTLNISSNRLEHFSDNLVRGTTREALRYLYLSANQLTGLSENVMDFDNSNPELMELSLGGNPWLCNCALGWMKTKINFIVQSSIRCAQPARLADRSLNTLTNASLCSTGNNENEVSTTPCDEQVSPKSDIEYIAIGSCVFIVIILVIFFFAMYRFRDRLCRRRSTPLPDKHPDMLYSLTPNSDDIPIDEIHLNTDGPEFETDTAYLNNNNSNNQIQYQGI